MAAKLSDYDRFEQARADLRRAAARAIKWAKVRFPVGRRVRYAHPVFRARMTAVVRGHQVDPRGGVSLIVETEPTDRYHGGYDHIGPDRVFEILAEGA